MAVGLSGQISLSVQCFVAMVTKDVPGPVHLHHLAMEERIVLGFQYLLKNV